MKKNEKMTLCSGIVFIVFFIVWTILIQTIDVRPVGVNDTNVGFATLNTWFHNLTKVNNKDNISSFGSYSTNYNELFGGWSAINEPLKIEDLLNLLKYTSILDNYLIK